jgi:Holliday junction resolvase RusA-like endonuclease
MTAGKLFACTIPGRPIVKKNTQRVVGLRGGGRRVIYSANYTKWANAACTAVERSREANSSPIRQPIIGVFRFYFKNYASEPDVSNLIEGPQDILTKCRVIDDDKLFRRVVAEKFFGEEPRVEIEIYNFLELNKSKEE